MQFCSENRGGASYIFQFISGDFCTKIRTLQEKEIGNEHLL
jgi:hypothetical protein